ncbi:hypothetical protein EAH73_03045 [Hymenobacter nivis]|uniref:Uncharacterized protein n=1 Tax=Hymenobacter nivis TaxID=1850093 RepID=A0A502HFA0_9BACT|nr:hypothetical protein EAH73_03045 [Hymenobacter nivis]
MLATAGLSLPILMLVFGWYRSLYAPGVYKCWLLGGLLLAAAFGYCYARPLRYPGTSISAGLLVPFTLVAAFGLVNQLSKRLNGRPFIFPNRLTITPAERVAINASDLVGYGLIMLSSYGMFFYWSVRISKHLPALL